MCHEWFTLASCSGYQALSNTEVCESVNTSVIKQSHPQSEGLSDRVSTRMGDHLVVPHAKLLSFSITMLISHDIATTLHVAKQIHLKGVF